jgi:hypothetical protein
LTTTSPRRHERPRRGGQSRNQLRQLGGHRGRQPTLRLQPILFNQVLRVGNFNHSDYQSVQLAVTRRLSRQWQMTASYVYSEALGNA